MEGKQTILVVEDNDGLSELLSSDFQQLGFNTFNAFSGQSAIDWLKTAQPLLMVLDYSLPDMNGKEFIMHLQQQHFDIPPFIITTGNSEIQTAIEMMKLGARDYVIKDIHFLEVLPLTVNKVVAQIERELKLKNAEQALFEANSLNRQIIKSAQDGIIVYDKHSRIIVWNEYMEKLTGVKSDEVIGKDPLEIFPFLKEVGVIDNIGNALKGESNLTTDFQFNIPNVLNAKWVSDAISPLYDASGEIMGAISIVADITKRKSSEIAIMESEAQFRSLFESAADAIFIADEVTGIIYDANEAASKLLKQPIDKIIGLHQTKLHPQSDIEPNRYRFRQHAEELKHNKSVHSLETLVLCSDGTHIPVEVLASKVVFKGHSCIMGTFRDISERKRSQAIVAARLHLAEFAIHHSLEEFIEEALNETEKLTESQIGFYHFVDEDQQTITLQAWSTRTKTQFCKIHDEGQHYPVSEAGVWTECLVTRAAVVHNDYEALQNKKGTPEGHARIVRELVVPVMRAGKVVAILGVGNKSEDYSNPDVVITSMFADLVWEMTESKRKDEELKKSNQRYEIFVSQILEGVYRFEVEPPMPLDLSFEEQVVHLFNGLTIADCNMAFLKMHGFLNQTDIIGARIKDLYRNETKESFLDLLRQFIQSGYTHQNVENAEPGSNGSMGYFLNTSVGIIENNCLARIMGTRHDITDRKQTELAVVESEQVLKSITNSAQDAIIMINNRGLITFFNPAAERILGYTQDEVIGHSLHPMLAPEKYQDQFIKSFAHFRNSGQGAYIGRPIELEAVQKSGRIITTELTLSSINIKGEWHAVGVLRDISERKLAEQALLESEARFKALHNASFGGIAIHDKGLILECNQGLVEMMGYPYEELIGMNGLLLIAEQDREMVMQNIINGYEKPYEAKGVRKNGEEFPMRLEGRNVPYKGKMVRTVEFRDITEQKKAEQAIAHSHQLMQYIIEHSQTGVAVHDRNLNYVYVSQQYLNDYNLKHDDIIGKHHYEIFPDLPQKWRDVHQKVLQGEVLGSEADLYERQDGTSMWTRWECRPWYEADGSIGGIIVYTESITDRVNSEMEREMLLQQVTNALDDVAKGKDLLYNILERVSDGFVAFDNDLNYTYVNQYGGKLLGRTPEELIGKNYWTEYPEAKDTPFAKAYVKALETQEPIVFEEYYEHWNRWFVNRIYPSKEGITIFFTDTTKLKEAENKLKESEGRAKAIVSALPDIVMRINRNFEVLDCEAPDEKLLYLPKAAFIGKPINTLLPSKIAELTTANVTETINEKQLHIYTYQLSVNNRLNWFEARMVPSGEDEVLVIIRDVTQQKELENELKVLSSAIEQNPATIVITDTKGFIEYVNPKFTELTGYTLEEAKGNNPRILKSGLTPLKDYESLWNTILEGRTWRGELCNKKKNGDLYWELVIISPVFDVSGKINHFVAVKEDITERKEVDRKVLSAIIEGEEKERNRFAQELHDGLGPILSSIKLYFQWLAETESSDKRDLIIQKGNNNIEEALQTLREISNNLSPRTLNTFGLTSSIQGFIEGINQLNKVKIDFETNLEGRFDKSIEISLYRVIMELINNSLKHSGATEISIQLELNITERLIKLHYSDNGKGFDYEANQKNGRGKGMLNIQNRVSSINGLFLVQSAIGMGIKVKIEVPV